MEVKTATRLTVDRVMRYSGRLETWDIFPGVTELPDEVAKELMTEFPQLTANEASPPTGGGAYANRMMTTGVCGQAKADGAPCQNRTPCRWHKATE